MGAGECQWDECIRQGDGGDFLPGSGPRARCVAFDQNTVGYLVAVVVPGCADGGDVGLESWVAPLRSCDLSETELWEWFESW